MRIIPDSKSLESISSSSESEREFTIGRDEERQQLDTTRHHKVHSHANQKRKLPSNNPEQQKQISEFPATFSPLFRQILLASAPVLATVSAGFTTGYSAIFLEQLQSNATTIKITRDEASWIASLAAFGMAPGCLVGGYVMQKYGRKFAHYLLCVPTVLGWLAIMTGQNVAVLLLGRFLTGLATGLLGPPASVYIGETSEPNYRGFLLASLTLSISLGILMCHVLGTFCHWKVVAFAASLIPLLICSVLAMVPESPIWLLTQHRDDEAKKAFKWLRGESADALVELESLVKKHEMMRKEDDAANVTNDDLLAKLKVNKNKPEFLKPLGIILFFFFVMQFSGVNSVAFYTVSLMKSIIGPTKSGDEYFSMLLIDTVRVVASFVACILLKLCYRRTLMLVSGIGTAVCMISAAMCMYYDAVMAAVDAAESPRFAWHSIGFLIGYICFVSVGLFPLPWVLQGEMLQQVTRGFGSGLTSCFNFVCFFVVVKTFVQMSETVGTFGVFMLYGFIALIGTIVLHFIMPETRNKTLQQIEESFSQK